MSSNLRVVPQSQDWVWDGAQWCPPCDGRPMPPPCPPAPWPCPPSGHPTPCPPWFPPPAGQAPWYPGANGGVSFSATPPQNPIRGNLWWDGTVLHLFDGAAWVDIGPQVAGSSGLMGVTDGSVAAPGFIGEVIKQTSSGTVTVVPPPGGAPTSFAALVVPAGDWNIQGTATFHDLTNGVYFDQMNFVLSMGSPAVTLASFVLAANFTATAGGAIGGTYSCAVFSLSVSTSTTINCALQIISVPGGTSGSGSYNFLAQARRMR